MKKNWANDFIYNESIANIMFDIMAGYDRLTLNHPKHKDVAKWDALATKWNKVRLDLPKLFFATEKEAKDYLKSLYIEKKALKKLEQNLTKLSNDELSES